MMALHGSNVPDDTWSLPRGYDYDWSKPTYLRNPELWKTAKTFLTEALDDSGTNVPGVDIPTRNVDEEVVHYNIMDGTASQSAVIYKVFGNIQEWMEWEAGDQNTKLLPLRQMVHGAAGTGKVILSMTLPFTQDACLMILMWFMLLRPQGWHHSMSWGKHCIDLRV
jgi:hypothetical protein